MKVTVGYDFEHDAPKTVPVPGFGGAHWLVGGSSGAGKTRLLHAVIAQLAPDPTTAIVASDPAMMDLKSWAPRLSALALGRLGAPWLLERLEAEFDRRLRAGNEADADVLPVTVDMPRIVAVFDELAMVTMTGGKDVVPRLIDLANVGRKVNIGLLLATQSPKATVVPMMVREQCAVRICLRTREPEQTDAILGTQRIPAHRIPAGHKGRAYVDDSENDVCQVRAPFIDNQQIRQRASDTAHLTPDLGEGWVRVWDQYKERAA